MSALRSPSSSTNAPPSKKGVFSSSSARRPSMSSAPASSGLQLPQGIGYSPGTSTTYYTSPSSPAGSGSGIPALRTLRSLLPFGPSSSSSSSGKNNVNATHAASSPSTTASPNPSTASRSPFSGFGSMRKSMTRDRERKISLSEDALSSPVIAIERQSEDAGLRRSVSLSRIEKPLPREPGFDGFSNSQYRQENGNSLSSSRDNNPLGSMFTLRTPSPGPPLSAELSTIIEADNSGVSTHLPTPAPAPSRPLSRSPSSSPRPSLRRPSPAPRDFLHPLRKADASATAQPHQVDSAASFNPDSSDVLDLSTAEVASQVRDALRKSTSSSKSGEPSWRDVDKAVVIIDADEHPEAAQAVDNIGNATLDLDTVDPDLLALLSPNSKSERPESLNMISRPSTTTKSTVARPPHSASPTTPTFTSSSPSTSRLEKARPSSSFIPRTAARMSSPRSPSASPSTPQFSIPTPSPTTPKPPSTPSTPAEKAKTPLIAVNGDPSNVLNSPSSPPASPPSTVTSTPAAPRRTFTLSRSTGAATGARRLFSPPSVSVSGASSAQIDETTSNGNLSSASAPASKPPRVSTRTLRQVMLSVSTSRHSVSRKNDHTSPSSPPSPHAHAQAHSHSQLMGRGSLDARRPLSRSAGLSSEIGLGRPSLDLDMRRGGSFDSRMRPDPAPGFGLSSNSSLRGRAGSDSPERANANANSGAGAVSSRPLAEVGVSPSQGEEEDMGFDEPSFFAQARGRPSIDSSAGTTPRPSFDTAYTGSRPGSRARFRDRDRDLEWERERERTPSLRVTDLAGESTSLASASSPPVGSASVASAPLTTRSSSASTGGVIARMRKRSMSVQERIVSPRGLGRLVGVANSEAAVSRPGSSLSVHGGGGRGGRAAGFGLDGYAQEGVSPVNSGGGGGGGNGPKMEWLGPRTAKAFRAAGLLDFDRDISASGNSSSGTAVLAPSPLSGGASSALSRFGSMRSASEYTPAHHAGSINGYNGHTRALSRMAFSDAGGPTESGRGRGRRGSESFSAYGGGGGGAAHGLGHSHTRSNGLMESPTFTASSGSRDRDRDRERDTPKSTPSTAPTSVSESFGYLGRARDLERERERDREEILALKEKHQSDMSAVISALTDAQRTAKTLRDENSELRERLDEALGALERDRRDMRRVLESVERENEGLRREVSELRGGRFRTRERDGERGVHAPGLTPSWSGSSTSSGLRTPVGRQVNGSPLAMDSTPQFLRQQEGEEEEEVGEGEEIYDNTMIIHDSVDDPRDDRLREDELELVHPSSTSTPSTKRRLSDSSSIFPAPPANMTMLLHEDAALHMGGSIRSNRSSADADHSQFQFSFASTAVPPSTIPSSTKPSSKPPKSIPITRSPPISYRSFTNSAEAGPGGHVLNKSIASTTSISPTTANFSMVTGSPGSLMLRPEHELLLGDMESLDLGVRSGNEELEAVMGQVRAVDAQDVW